MTAPSITVHRYALPISNCASFTADRRCTRGHGGGRPSVGICAGCDAREPADPGLGQSYCLVFADAAASPASAPL
jgi:hypothetical protein